MVRRYVAETDHDICAECGEAHSRHKAREVEVDLQVKFLFLSGMYICWLSR